MPWPYDMVACSIGFQVWYARSRPVASPGKPTFVWVPNPTSERMVHSFRGAIASAIFAEPTFDDFWITCATVSIPSGCASRMVRLPIV